MSSELHLILPVPLLLKKQKTKKKKKKNDSRLQKSHKLFMESCLVLPQAEYGN